MPAEQHWFIHQFVIDIWKSSRDNWHVYQYREWSLVNHMKIHEKYISHERTLFLTEILTILLGFQFREQLWLGLRTNILNPSRTGLFGKSSSWWPFPLNDAGGCVLLTVLWNLKVIKNWLFSQFLQPYRILEVSRDVFFSTFQPICFLRKDIFLF